MTPVVEKLGAAVDDWVAGHHAQLVSTRQVTVDALHGAEYAVRHRHPRHLRHEIASNAHERPERG